MSLGDTVLTAVLIIVSFLMWLELKLNNMRDFYNK